jgi:hypothetical protein
MNCGDAGNEVLAVDRFRDVTVKSALSAASRSAMAAYAVTAMDGIWARASGKPRTARITE